MAASHLSLGMWRILHDISKGSVGGILFRNTSIYFSDFVVKKQNPVEVKHRLLSRYLSSNLLNFRD